MAKMRGIDLKLISHLNLEDEYVEFLSDYFEKVTQDFVHVDTFTNEQSEKKQRISKLTQRVVKLEGELSALTWLVEKLVKEKTLEESNSYPNRRLSDFNTGDSWERLPWERSYNTIHRNIML